MKTVFRPQFWLDLAAGVAYLAEKASPEIARRWHAEVMATVNRLEQWPDLGRLRRDLNPPDIRSLVLPRYPAISCSTVAATTRSKCCASSMA